MLEYWVKSVFFSTSFAHYSIIPLFQYSSIPLFQYFLQHGIPAIQIQEILRAPAHPGQVLDACSFFIHGSPLQPIQISFRHIPEFEESPRSSQTQ
jgi:hypothetical protein